MHIKSINIIIKPTAKLLNQDVPLVRATGCTKGI